MSSQKSMIATTVLCLTLICAVAADSTDYTLERMPDIIIVGAGSAGSVLASRMSEVPELMVLLIEAGGDPLPETENPGAWVEMLDPSVSSQVWNFTSQPDPRMFYGLDGGVNRWSTGKGLGGSSLVNAMAYERGTDLGYDTWESAGNPGWGYKDVYPYFLKSEDFRDSSRQSEYHSVGGYLTVSPAGPINEAGIFLEEAAEELGVEITDDLNKGKYNVLGQLDLTLRDGLRCSTEKAFLQPARNRSNLVIWKNTEVTKVLIDETSLRAYGVEYVDDAGNSGFVNCSQEVILSAGTVNSPKVLMLSGVGPFEHLTEKNIESIKDLPVGENLQDPLSFSGVQFSIPEDKTKIFPSMLTNVMGSINTKNISAKYPNIELVGLSIAKNNVYKNGKGFLENIFGMSQATSNIYKELNSKSDILAIVCILRQPKSRGRILLQDNDYKSPPIIEANYLSDVDGEDMMTMMDGIDFVVSMNDTQTFRDANIVLERLNFPSCSQYSFPSREYWTCAIREVAGTMYLHAGSNKMGPASDATSVVNSELKVHGISGLRVVDASIMPIMPATHINAATIMIAEKVADIIKKEYNSQRK